MLNPRSSEVLDGLATLNTKSWASIGTAVAGARSVVKFSGGGRRRWRTGLSLSINERPFTASRIGNKRVPRGFTLRRQLDKSLGVPLILVLAQLRNRQKKPEEVHKIVVLQNPTIGDTVLMTGPL